jgi:hypothetical protein
MKRRVSIPLAAALLIASCAVAAGDLAAKTGATPLNQIALRAAQVGPLYRAEVIRSGRSVRNQVSLDLCGFRFPSEALRAARLQLAYQRPGVKLALSSEVVRYRAGGALQAFLELQYAVANCPTKPVRGPVGGVGPLTWRVNRISDPRLPPASIALDVHVTGTVEGKKVVDVSTLVYQVRGEVLSAVYTYGGTAAASRRFALNAAVQSAGNLRRS